LTPGDVRRAATTCSLKVTKVGELYEAQQINDVVVWGAAHTRTDIEALRRLRISLPAGGDAPAG
jgi:Cu/Ag efflux pump CusA